VNRAAHRRILQPVTATSPARGKHARALALLATCLPLLAQAQAVAPTPGAILDSVPGRGGAPTVSNPPEVLFSRDPVSTPRPQAQRFLVSGFTFTGNTVFPEALLRRLTEPYLDLQLTLVELDRIADRVTAFYRNQGYTVARAYVPAQRVEDGLVTIQVIEGTIEAARFRGQSRYGTDFLQPYLAPLIDGGGGKLVRDELIERQLLLLNDLPGLRARATLVPGQRFGSTAVEVDTQEKFVNATVGLNNSGNEVAGRYRIDAGLEFNNPLRLGDQAGLRAIRSTDNLFRYLRMAYSLPIGTNGLRLAVSATQSDYELGGSFKALQIAGQLRSFDATVSYPFRRSRANNVIGALQWRQTTSEQTTLGLPFSNARLPVTVASVYANWVGDDSSASALSVAATTNALQRGSNSQSGAYPSFTKFDADWTYLTGASRNWDFFYRARGVMATQKLPDTEKASIGGADSVRGYSSAQLRGDAGYQMTFELRRQMMLSSLPGHASVFADLGGVRNKGFIGWDRMSSVGVGWTQYLAGRGQVKLEVARPLIKITNQTTDTKVWLSLNLAF
jgi:hemolysin activation/secretion protein